jgi:hypothetical protein
MRVELFGPARVLAGAATIELAIDEPVDECAFVRALALAVPAFAGQIVDAAAGAFIAPNLLLLDGRRSAAGSTFGVADRPCVLFLPSGG